MLLNEVSDRIFASSVTSFDTVSNQDLRHNTVSDDESFFRILAHKLGEVANEYNGTDEDDSTALAFDAVEDMLNDNAGWKSISDSFEIFGEVNARVLIILDGLDDVLKSTSITRNVWDNLRALSEMDSCTLVTGSRQPLRELCSSADARTSDFWNIFHPQPIIVGAFTDEDIEHFLEPLNSRNQLTTNAKGAFAKQTGGIPLIASVVALDLWNTTDEDVKIEQGHILESVERISQRPGSVIGKIWADCPTLLQSVLHDLQEQDRVPAEALKPQRKRSLLLRGLVEENEEYIELRCQLMSNYIREQGAEVSELQDLFSEEKQTKRNTKAFLEIRLDSIQGGNNELRNDLQKAIADLSIQPHRSLQRLRAFAHTALNDIWNTELQNRQLPSTEVDNWPTSRYYFRHAKQSLETNNYEIPSSRSKQEDVLRAMTDGDVPTNSNVTHGSACLIGVLRDLGNYGTHVEDAGQEEVPFQTAASMCFIGVELFRRITEELR
jgi:hypothetical protein